MPGCNDLDKVKARQALTVKTFDQDLDLESMIGTCFGYVITLQRGNTGISRVSPTELNVCQRMWATMSYRAGKPCAVKVARTVWGGGKAVKPYLSLRAPFNGQED